MKPKYTYLYKSDNAVDDILSQPPFTYDEPINKKVTGNKTIIEFEYFDLFCYRMDKPCLSMKGHKTWQILVEDILFNEFDNNYIQDVLEPMMCPYDLLGGRVVKVYKY